jgi:hypothetical protein
MHSNRNGFGNAWTRLAGAVVVLGVMAGGCDAIFPKKVKDEDCDKWVNHAFDVAKEGFEAAIKSCPDDMKKQMKKGMDKGLEKEKDKAVKRCKKHVDEKYESKDAECWTKAADLKALKACKFKMGDEGLKDPKNDDDKDPQEVFDDLKKMCDKAAKAKGGDDDDDKKKKGDDDDDSKKKSKKKGDDDDN